MGKNARYRKRMWHQAAAIGLGILILAAAVFYTGKLGPATHLQVWFDNPGGKSSPKYWLEISETEPKRNIGLMWRKELPADGGMIFIYPEDGNRTFWMKDTLIPLDMIFVNSKYEVVGVLNGVPAMTMELRRVDKQSQFIVELAGGKAQADGIAAGSLMKFKGEMPKGVK